MDKNALEAIITQAKQAAAAAAQAYVDNWTAETGGNQYGEPMYCGYAWVYINKHNGIAIKGNTKLGRAMKAAGVEQDYTRAFRIHDPSGWGGQSMDVKQAGAQAAVKVFVSYGFEASAGGHAD